MIRYIENKLYEKTKDTQSEILYAQWNYDKKVIPTALQLVSNLFPHYSLHDESHSITIINNIVRILGKENIDKLSSIDLWLILEASYCHDIGMVVSSDDMITSLQSKEFIEFFKSLQTNEKNGLYTFAIQFEIKDNQIYYKSNQFDLKSHDGIKFILAEYFRTRHSDRSLEIINDPLNKLSLSSPRDVIPPRIFNILGEICASHTKNFSDVMKLSFSEVGIDIEDAHPRFISCLLRIGDLLDLDNNRFSEVMLRTLTKIPIDTINHKSKHLSIKSFRVDRKEISIFAECTEYETASITQHWFNYIDSEIKNQLIHWNKIVPCKDLGFLPTIGKLEVKLEDYEYIDGKNRPRFQIDTDKALSLLQGAGLYKTSSQSIREILQNAVDATLLRVWLENKDELQNLEPNSDEFINILKAYPITIKIEKNTKESGFDWNIEIEDNGIGISENDLKYIMNTGSSSKNTKKYNIIDEMPLWIQPSGAFGIGFQSIFLLTNQVKVTTKSFFDEQLLEIELNNPNSSKNGDILIKKFKTDHSKKPGCIIKFDAKLIKKEQIIINYENNHEKILNYDFFANDSFDIEIKEIFYEIDKFFTKSQFKINLFINNEEVLLEKLNSQKFDYYDKNRELELSFLGIEKEPMPYRNNKIYYKNQIIENIYIPMEPLKFEVNIFGKASDILSINRNGIKGESIKYIRNKILESMFDYCINRYYEYDEKERIYISIFFNISNKYINNKFNIEKFNDWEKYEIEDKNGKKITIGEICKNFNSIKIIEKNDLEVNTNPKINNIFEIIDNELVIRVEHIYLLNNVFLRFFLEKIEISFTSIFYDENIIISKEKQEDYMPKEKYEKLLKDLKDNSYVTRSLIPCQNKYLKIRLKNQVYFEAMGTYGLHGYFNVPIMLSPFVIITNENKDKRVETKINDKLINWVYDNRFDEKVTKEEIKNTYDEFIIEFKEIVIQ
ncbi:HD domain-containing protein [Aliarcobacter butzleri]|uniref:HD domain-containing protein n=1 Tax=Aliarcobacter butzleri TaxID=28197 RepID=UPI00263F197C|nr:ATP-binding protein [Aliarcobacter butzleri]MDN5090918.1 ATP-binding protein [Aliarcobacter butzleri]